MQRAKCAAAITSQACLFSAVTRYHLGKQLGVKTGMQAHLFQKGLVFSLHAVSLEPLLPTLPFLLGTTLPGFRSCNPPHPTPHPHG